MGKEKQHTESSSRRNSICVSNGEDKTYINCFSSCGLGGKDRFGKRQQNTKICVEVKYDIFDLPDDIIEMCLDRVPLKGLKNARLVCKKWRSSIYIRKVGARYKNIWLFVFCTPYYSLLSRRSLFGDINMIHALDLYRNQWHNIDANFLKGRFKFATANILDGLFIVGGNSKNRFTVKQTKHKEVMFYNVVFKSWINMPSMIYARSLPVLGVTDDPIIPHIRQRRSDPSTLSSKSFNRSYLLISIGGIGIYDRLPLNCGEMYDSLTNEWTEISRLPFIASFGTFCGSKFYACSRDEKLAAYDIERDVWIEIQTYPPFAPNINAESPQLVSSNGRLFLMLKLHLLATGTKVKQLWELDLMDHTWTEISINDHGVELDGKSEVYVADRNLIFGVEMWKGVYDNIFVDFTVCDVSESNTNEVYWKKISWKGVDPKWGAYSRWTTSTCCTSSKNEQLQDY